MAASAFKFSSDKITDSKRLVRGEHLLLARNLLRIEYGHFGKKRALMLAGENPSEEIEALRVLFGGIHVTCADLDSRCLESAIEAGADEVLKVDIHGWKKGDEYDHARKKQILYPEGLHGKCFELIDLDFCGPVDEGLRETINAYKYLLAKSGVLMVTFSYGRDVVERFIAVARGGDYMGPLAPGVQELIERGLTESVFGRIAFLAEVKAIKLLSVLLYPGNRMPMCSLLFQRRHHGGGSLWVRRGNQYGLGAIEGVEFPPFTIVGPLDLDSMLMAEAIPSVYGVPSERIERARRTFTALKASASRQANLQLQSANAVQSQPVENPVESAQ